MPSPEKPAAPAEAGHRAAVAARPSALDLARLSERPIFPPGGTELYRHMVRLVELGPGQEFLLVPCGRGVTARFLATASEASGAGADPDAELVDAAEAAARREGLAQRLHFEHAPPDDLPYKDAVFDVAVGELALAAADDPPAAVRELARVTRPMGSVILVQLTWLRRPEGEERDLLLERLGVRPYLLMEWKQMLRDAGVVDLYVEDWSHAASSLRHPMALGGLAEFAGVRDRLAVLTRAWRRWGWRGVRWALPLEREIRRLLGEDRVLGLSLIKGTRWPEPPDGSA